MQKTQCISCCHVFICFHPLILGTLYMGASIPYFPRLMSPFRLLRPGLHLTDTALMQSWSRDVVYCWKTLRYRPPEILFGCEDYSLGSCLRWLACRKSTHLRTPAYLTCPIDAPWWTLVFVHGQTTSKSPSIFYSRCWCLERWMHPWWDGNGFLSQVLKCPLSTRWRFQQFLLWRGAALFHGDSEIDTIFQIFKKLGTPCEARVNVEQWCAMMSNVYFRVTLKDHPPES